MNALKTTLIGGIVFLMPIIALVAILGYALKIMMTVVAPLEKMIPMGSVAGVAVINILAFIAILVVCFLAGLVARSEVVTRAVNKLEEGLLTAIPGYAFFKAMMGSLGDGGGARHMIPVVVRFDDLAQVAFEIERIEDGQVVVYLPGAPDPSSGSVILMEPDRVQRLEVTAAKAMRNLRTLGRGSRQVLGL